MDIKTRISGTYSKMRPKAARAASGPRTAQSDSMTRLTAALRTAQALLAAEPDDFTTLAGSDDKSTALEVCEVLRDVFALGVSILGGSTATDRAPQARAAAPATGFQLPDFENALERAQFRVPAGITALRRADFSGLPVNAKNDFMARGGRLLP